MKRKEMFERHCTPHVLIAVNMADSWAPDFLRGILTHCSAIGAWDVEIVRSPQEFTAERVRGAAEKNVGGMILALRDGPAAAFKAVVASATPLVTFGVFPPILNRRTANVTHVVYDNADIGKVGASHFIRLNRFKSYAYVGPAATTSNWSSARLEGFCSQIRRHGETPSVFSSRTENAWNGLRRRLPNWLRLQPKPLAILASDDITASQILLACHDATLKIPGEVSVLGINDSMICEGTNPPLSSINTPCSPGGVLAARELVRLMRRQGATSSARTIVLPSQNEVVTRSSTPSPSNADSLVNRALAFIRQNAHWRITPPDVQAHLHCSRALMDLRFRENHNETVAETIVAARLDVLTDRLTSSSDSIDAIVSRLGWPNPNYLKRLFKKRFNMTMRDFRKTRSGVFECQSPKSKVQSPIPCNP